MKGIVMRDGYVILTQEQARSLLQVCSAVSSMDGALVLRSVEHQLNQLAVEDCSGDFARFTQLFDELASAHVEEMVGQAPLISLQQIAARVAGGAGRSIGGISETAALIARNPDLLRGDYNPGEEGGYLYEGVADAFSEAVGAELYSRAERMFVEQFQVGFKPVANFRNVGRRLIDSWLKSQKNILTAPASATRFKEMLSGLTNGQDSVVWHLEALLRGHAKLRKTYGSEYALAKDALGIVGSFRERDRLAKRAA
jgi:hypothetical protein